MSGYGEGGYGEGFYGGGVALLADQLTGASLRFEIAWGADLTDLDGSSWVWVDETEYVRQGDGLSITLGRSDEASASQPASLTCTLNNSDARYSLGAISPNWPYVRRNVPVRLRVDPGTGTYRVVFQGGADGFQPGWDSNGGTIPVVTLSASGILRTLAQGKDPLGSALYRYLTIASTPAEYWPAEEDKAATQLLSAVEGGGVGTFVPLLDDAVHYGRFDPGQDTDYPAASRAMAISNGATVVMQCRPSLIDDDWAVSWSMKYSDVSGAVVRIRTNNFAAGFFIFLIWYTNGTAELYEVAGGVSTLRMAWSMGDSTGWDDVWHDYVLRVDQRTGTPSWTMYVDGASVDTAVSAALATGKPNTIEFETEVAGDPQSFSHVAVWADAADTLTVADLHSASIAHRGELATDRIERLCDEQGLPVTIHGTSANAMGPQRPVPVLTLLRECEAVDQGILYDGTGIGLQYICRSERENAAVAVTLNADELSAPFTPVDDDQRTRNRITASATTGGQYTAEDTDGNMGTKVIGVFDSSIEVNVSAETDTPNYASWLVHLGTIEGYRYPSVTIDVRNVPTLVDELVDLTPSSHIQITNPDDVLASFSTDNIDQVVEGISMTITPYEWYITLKCSPYGSWAIATIASASGDTDAHLLRLDSTSSVLSVASSSILAYFTVAKATEPWTEVADDFPLYIEVAGAKYTCTGIATSGATQRLTVSEAIPDSIPIGTPVTVWSPPVLGL